MTSIGPEDRTGSRSVSSPRSSRRSLPAAQAPGRSPMDELLIEKRGALNRRWGVPFIDGGTQRFPRIMGQGNALWMIETGIRIDAPRAMAIGLVQEVVAEGAALDRALELADRIAGYPQTSLHTDRA